MFWASELKTDNTNKTGIRTIFMDDAIKGGMNLNQAIQKYKMKYFMPVFFTNLGAWLASVI